MNSSNPRLFFAAAVSLIGTSLSVNAQTLLNGDFSLPSVPHFYSPNAAPDDFTATVAADQTDGNIGVIAANAGFTGGLNTTTSPTAQFEYQSAGATTASVDVATSIGIYQEVGALQANTTYTFTVGEALSSQYGGSGTFELGLYSGATPTAALSTQLLLNQTDTASSAADYDQFQYETVTYTTGAAPVGYLTVALSLAGATSQGYFANATLTSTPEPSSEALVLAGVGALVATVIYRRRTAKP